MRLLIALGLGLYACGPQELADDVVDTDVDDGAVAPDRWSVEGVLLPRDRANTFEARDLAPNVLIVLLDDIGTDAISTYGEQPGAPYTPVLDSLAAQGVLFRNVWAEPSCAPARANLLTGRYASRTGLGGSTHPLTGKNGLPLEEVTLAEVVRGAPDVWSTEALGKWHLTTPDVGGIDHPNLQGFDHYRGAIGNLSDGHAYDGKNSDHGNFEKVIDGVAKRVRRFDLADEIDDTIAAVTTLPEPWFVYLATHMAHAPFQVPPEALLGGDVPNAGKLVEVFRSMVRASDAELGRLMASVDLSRTVVIIAGDNGTPEEATVAPFKPEYAKKTFGEGGLGVPMIVVGAGVRNPGREVATPVHFVDIFPTVAELAHVPQDALPVLDGESLVTWLVDDARDQEDRMIYAETTSPNGPDPVGWVGAVRDLRWKYARASSGIEVFYDLAGRNIEGRELLGAGDLTVVQADALERLRAELSRRRASFVSP